MNKTINIKVLAIVDLLKELSKKIFKKVFYYLGISAFTTFLVVGVSTTAQAVNVAADDIWADAISSQAGTITDPSDDMAVDLKGYSLSFVTAGDGQAVGAITDTGGASATDLAIDILNTNGGGALTQSIASIIIDGKMVVRNIDDEASMTVSVTSTGVANVIAGVLQLTSSDATADGDITMDVNSSLEVTGITTLTANTGSAASDVLLIVDKAATFTAGVVLDDDTGLATLELEQNNAVTIAGTIQGASDGEGTLLVTGTGKTFSGVIGGGSKGLLEVQVDSATAIFSEAVTATTADLNASATFKKALTSTTIALTGATATFNNTDAVTIAGAITNSGTTVVAVLNSANNEAPSVATFSGAVDATTITIGATATGGSAKFSSTVAGASTIHGGEDATEDSQMEITGTHTGAVVLTQAGSGDAVFKTSGSTALSITGALTVTTDADGKIDITSTARTTFDGLVGAAGANRVGEVDINASAIATFSNLVATDLLEIVGSVTLGENNNDALDFNIGASGKLIIGKTVVATETLLTDVANASPTVTSGAKLYAPINLKTGTAIILTDGADGAGDDTTMIAALTTAAVDSILTDYTVTIDASNDQSDLNATVKSIATTASEAGITTNAATAMHQAYLAAIDDTSVDDGAEEAFEDALLNSAGTYSATEDTNLALQVAPQTDGIAGSTLATRAMTGTVQGIVSNRMASLRSGDAYVTGIIAGNNMSSNSGFFQIFGTDVTQKNTSVGNGTEYGYDADTLGIALGFDGITEDGSIVGFSFSRSETDVAGKGTGNSKNDIESYTASIYADKVTDNGYLEGSLTIGINDNATSRIVNTGGLDRTYKGSYDSEQVSLKIGGGVPNQMNNGAFITPFGSITGTLIQTDTYTETSTTSGDNLRLTTAQDDISSIVGSVGFKAHKANDEGTPMISLAINNEFGDNTINNTNTYKGGGSSFKTSTNVEELSATLGLGYSFSSDGTSFNIGYEAEANEDDYLSHYGTLKFVHKF